LEDFGKEMEKIATEKEQGVDPDPEEDSEIDQNADEEDSDEDKMPKAAKDLA
jgi:hypothetical protein